MKSIIKAILCIGFGVIIGYCLHKEDTKIEFKEITRDSIIRDSIYIVNDSLENTIVYIETTHEKISNDIMSNTDSANM